MALVTLAMGPGTKAGITLAVTLVTLARTPVTSGTCTCTSDTCTLCTLRVLCGAVLAPAIATVTAQLQGVHLTVPPGGGLGGGGFTVNQLYT